MLVSWWSYFGFLRGVVDVSSTFRRAEIELHMKSVTWDDVCLFLWLSVNHAVFLCYMNVAEMSFQIQRFCKNIFMKVRFRTRNNNLIFKFL